MSREKVQLLNIHFYVEISIYISIMVYSDLGNIIKDVNTLSELALCKLNDVDFPVPFAKAYYKFKKI